jgi:predicted alpha/beta-hydrolase family hydrolase
MADVDLLVDGPERGPTLVLAHGAGAPMDSPFMVRMAEGVADQGIRVVRFEFPYMHRRREGGGRPGPNPARVLQDSWRAAARQLGDPAELVIGGKSLGGRMASMVADELGVKGLVCLGYPFHPPGKPERLRTAHLLELRTPALVVQGTRDGFGTPDEIRSYGLPATIRLLYLEDGDHSFKPRVRSGRTEEQNLAEAIDGVAGFVDRL